MRILHSALVCIALIGFRAPLSFTQTPRQSTHPVAARTELELGSVTVWLGMAETDTLGQFKAAGYYIGKASPDVMQLITNGSDMYAVWFKQGKLAFAERDWYTGNEVMSSVLGALSTLDRQDAHSCTISRQPQRRPGTEVDSVMIYCQDRSVQLFDGTVTVNGKTLSATAIKEIIGSRE